MSSSIIRSSTKIFRWCFPRKYVSESSWIHLHLMPLSASSTSFALHSSRSWPVADAAMQCSRQLVWTNLEPAVLHCRSHTAFFSFNQRNHVFGFRAENTGKKYAGILHTVCVLLCMKLMVSNVDLLASFSTVQYALPKTRWFSCILLGAFWNAINEQWRNWKMLKKDSGGRSAISKSPTHAISSRHVCGAL